MDKKGYTLKDIIEIQFYFDNNEDIKVPIECISNLQLKLKNNDTEISKFKCTIEYNGNIKAHLFDKFTSPIKRFIKKDVVGIVINWNDEFIQKLEVPCEIYDNNTEDSYGYDTIDYSCNQHTNLISYKEIELYIAENSKEYSLQEALEELVDGDIIIDSKGNEYEICELEETGEKYLNTIIKQSLLHETFARKV